MSKFNIVRRCYNCGAILQAEDKEAKGYITPKFLETPPSVKLFCDECWAEQTYNIAPQEPQVSEDFLHMLEDAKASDALIVYVVDLFSFEASFSSKISKLLQGLKVLVIGNKRDLLPEEANDDDLKAYVAHRFRVAKINVKTEQVILTTLKSEQEIKDIASQIKAMRQGHDVYVIGAVQAGKTVFINSFLKSYSNKSNRYVNTSLYPGTKLKVLCIPLDKSSSIYDTPGISIENSVMSVADLRHGSPEPKTEISKKLIQLQEDEGFVIGALAAIQLLKGNKTAIKAYFAPNTTISKYVKEPTKSILGEIRRGTPRGRKIRAMTDFDVFDIEVDEKGSRDIGIEGLGWINFTADNQTFRITVPKGVSVYTSRAKIK